MTNDRTDPDARGSRCHDAIDAALDETAVTVKLPEWIEKATPTGYETKDGETIHKLLEALTIAIDALEYDTREHSVGFGCAGTQIRASQALARIAALGGK